MGRAQPLQASATEPIGIGGASRAPASGWGATETAIGFGVVALMVLLAAGLHPAGSRVRGRALAFFAAATTSIVAGIALVWLGEASHANTVVAGVLIVAPLIFGRIHALAARAAERVQAEIDRREARLEAERERPAASMEGELEQLREAIATESTADENAAHKARLQVEIRSAREQLELLRAYQSPRPARRTRR